MRTVTGVIGSWKTTGRYKNKDTTRFTHLEVDGEPQGKPTICKGLVRILQDKIEGECTLYIGGNQIVAIKYGDRMYQKEKANNLMLGFFASLLPVGIIMLANFESNEIVGLIGIPVALIGLMVSPVSLFYYLFQNRHVTEANNIAKREGMKFLEV